MKRLLLFTLAFGLSAPGLIAQTAKIGVLVVGNGNNALGAGVQSARSGVKTSILMTEDDFDVSLPNNHRLSGLERELTQNLSSGLSMQNYGNGKIKEWADTVKNLNIIRGASWVKFKRSGSGWIAELSNGQIIRAKILVDADRSGKLKASLGVQYTPGKWQRFTYKSNIYRTSIASGFAFNGSHPGIFSLYQLLLPEQENLIALIPEQQSITGGQAAGATAAYAAFFDKKTSQASLKRIQGELINFKHSLLPFQDVAELDSNWKAIQFVALSGMLKGDSTSAGVLFHPDRSVTTAELKEPFKEYFYKAQIWFDDHKATDMTLESALDLICYTGSKSLETTRAEVIKNWKKIYKFDSDFDGNRIITRREFCVLLFSYNNPFNVNIDKSGRVTR